MTWLLRHLVILFMLAAGCYVIAIAFSSSRLGFILFFVFGFVTEVIFWILFWRERSAFRRSGIDGHA